MNATEKTLQKEGKNDKNEKGGTVRTEQATTSTEEATLKPAYWPLIRQVTIRTRAAALSTGAILVDLPGKYLLEGKFGMAHDKMVKGVADTNVARNQIAKNYLQKSHRIWILAPITRAVDDKIAKGLVTLD